MRWILAAALVAASGCKPPPPAAPTSKPPAVVAREGDLLTIALTPEAEARLGLRTEAVVRRKVPRTRLLGGEALVPPGRDAVVTAPLAGLLGGGPLVAGRRLAAGQTVLTLTPILSAEARASTAAARSDAEGAVRAAKVQLDAAGLALERAEQLLRDKAGSRRAVDEARAQKDVAAAVLAAAESRREVLGAALGEQAILSPMAGLLRKLHAVPGQSVAAGAPLFEVADLDRLWIRVAVHVAEAGAVDPTLEIRVEGLVAKPVAAPPAADPAAATVDFMYEAENAGGALRPGQKVSAALPLRTAEEALVVPWSAVIHDVQGGAWVYERSGEGRFARRRVSVSRVSGGAAVLEAGPREGTAVVTAGAAELYGAEFGHGK